MAESAETATRRGSCGDCKFFARLETQCRKNPPVGMPVPQPGGVAFLQVFPPAKPSDWCGAFEALPPVLA